MLDGFHLSGSHATAHSEAAAKAAALVHAVGRISLKGLEVDLLGVKHTQKLLEGQHEIHVGTDGLPVGLQLLGGAGPDKDDTGVGMILLDHPGCDNHGGQGHGDVVLELGEELLGHHGPGGAAAGAHPVQLFGDFLQEVMGLLHGAQVSADGYFHHVGKAQGPHGGFQLGGSSVGAVLSHKCGSHAGDDLFTTLDGLDQLEDLALVGDGGEGAVHQAHTAGDALIIIDLSPAQLIGLDGVHAAGGSTGALHLGDRPVGALVKALAALDTLALINVAALVFIQIDGVLGADVHAGVGNAALAAVGDADLLGRAGVAGIGDDIDQGLVEIFLIRGGILDIGADGGRGAVGVQIHAQSQLEPGGNNGPLQEHVMAMVGNLSGNDLVGDHVHLLVIVALIGQSGHFCEYAAADIVYRAVYTSHVFPPVSGSSRILLRHR